MGKVTKFLRSVSFFGWLNATIAVFVLAVCVMVLMGMTPCRMAKVVDWNRDCRADLHQYFQ